MNNVLELLGKEVTDRVTGFKGTVTGIAVYLAGCHQACVFPKVGADNKMADALWLDCARLAPSEAPALVLSTMSVGEVPGVGGDGPKAPAR